MPTSSGGSVSGAALRLLSDGRFRLSTNLGKLAVLGLSVGILQSWTSSATRAQSPTAQPPITQVQLDDKPMRVSIIRYAQPGCEPNCPEWIAATGRIDPTTPAAFRQAFARLGKRKLPVLIDSRGGSVDHALAVGRMIRARGLDVAVTRTVLTPCAATDTSCRKLHASGTLMGRPEARITICASSCAFILAGGVKRYVGPWTIVGLHEIKSTATMRRFQRLYRVERRYSWGVPVEVRRTLIRERTLSTQTIEMATGEKTYEKIKSYFAEMGVADGIMPILRSAPHSSIRWLRPNELRITALATDLVNGEQLLAVTPPSAQPPSAVAVAEPAQPTTASPAPASAAPTDAAAPVAAAPIPSAQMPAPATMPPGAAAAAARPAATTDPERITPPPSANPAAPAKSAAKPKPRPALASTPPRQEDRRLPLGFQ